MDYVQLGRAGVKVSRLCLGTMNFGPFSAEQDSFRIMDRARELGINFFDTANVYGRDKGRGATETILGRWFNQGDGRRDSVVLATKVYGKMGDGPNDGRLSAHHIRMACEASLRRLQTDHIDLYQMHHVDRDTHWDEIWQVMEQLVREGKVTYVGSSNFAGWHVAQASETASHRNFLGLVSEQSLYNLTCRTVELEVIPACLEYGLGVLPWSPLAGGALGGAFGDLEEGRRVSDWTRKTVEKYRDQLTKFEAFCRKLESSPAVVSLAWLLTRKGVVSPIIGPRTMDQLEESMKALDLELTEKHLEALDEIWPGPGGPAPEAYAW